MPEIAPSPRAYIHRIDGRSVAPPSTMRLGALPGARLLRFVIGVWPATLTVVAAATLAVTTAL